MATIDRSKGSLPARVADLPPRFQMAAKSLRAAMSEATQGHSALELVRIVSAVMGEEFASRPKPQSGLAMALMRGAIVREEMKAAEGGSLSAEEAGKALGITKAAVLKRYKKGQLLGWRDAKQNAVRFPVWQFADSHVLPGLAGILAVFREEEWMDDWGKIAFFLTPLSSMKGRRPLDLLREGEIPAVMRAARSNVE